MFSRFFIHRPIFAAVVSIVIVIAGGVSLLTLPVAQFPDIAPPTVTVSTSYPGASAVVVAETVATPIEQEVNGVENSIYMSSVCGNDGSYSLTVTFEPGTDLDIAQVQVQNRVQSAMPKLPEEVKRLGVNTKKKSPDFALMVSLYAKDKTKKSLDALFLNNYAVLRLKDVLARTPGVGDMTIFGASEYSMRIWLDPEQAAGARADDDRRRRRDQASRTCRSRRARSATRRRRRTSSFQYTVKTLGRLENVDQFESIIVKTGEGGRITRVKRRRARRARRRELQDVLARSTARRPRRSWSTSCRAATCSRSPRR